MRVFAHYYSDEVTGIEYRWRTLLQLGDSWDVCGTVVMKNPGSSKPTCPIGDSELLSNLRRFDSANNYTGYGWYHFSVDNTMGLVRKLIEAYLVAHNKPAEGVIQIFNLFNIRDVDLNKGLEKIKASQGEPILMTTDDDINNLVPPIYLGWGNLKNNKLFKGYAEKFFEKVKQDTSYLDKDYNKNPFYHPQYLLVYGNKREKCKEVYSKFIK
jgi:hypothetical protein